MKSASLFRHASCLFLLALAACGGQQPDAESAPVGQSAPPVEQAAAEPAVPAVDENSPGALAYQKTCAACHATTALGAPMLGKKDDWTARIAQGEEVLYQHAMEGFIGDTGMMPARGGDASMDDETVKAVVDYMIAKAR